MSNNPFDTLGQYDDDLNGIFGSIKKAWGKAKKKVEKVRNTVEKTLGVHKVMSQVRKTATTVSRNKVVRIGAAVAAAYVVGPMALTALKAGAVSAVKIGGSILSKAAVAKAGVVKAAGAIIKSSVVKQAGATVVKAAVETGVKSAQMAQTIKYTEQMADIQNQANATTQAELGVDAQTIARLSQDPKFKEVYDTLKAQGHSDAAIAKYWAESDMYKQTAIPQIAATIQPQIHAGYIQDGVPPNLARRMSEIDAYDIAEAEVEKVATGIDTKSLLIIGIPILAAIFMG